MGFFTPVFPSRLLLEGKEQKLQESKRTRHVYVLIQQDPHRYTRHHLDLVHVVEYGVTLIDVTLKMDPFACVIGNMTMGPSLL